MADNKNASPSVAVKALEWEIDEPEWHVAKTCFGFGYEVRKTDRGAVRFRYGTRSFEPFEGSFEAAKAFCQADYEARIRSALSAQVQDVAGWQPDDYYSDDPEKLKQLLAQRDKWLVDNDHWHDFTLSLPTAPAKQEG